MSSPETTIDAASPVNVIDLVVKVTPLTVTVIVVATGLLALAVPWVTYKTPPTPVFATALTCVLGAASHATTAPPVAVACITAGENLPRLTYYAARGSHMAGIIQRAAIRRGARRCSDHH
jgi:hypothetical protein